MTGPDFASRAGDQLAQKDRLAGALARQLLLPGADAGTTTERAQAAAEQLRRYVTATDPIARAQANETGATYRPDPQEPADES